MSILSNKWFRRTIFLLGVLILAWRYYVLLVDARRQKSNYEILVGEKEDQLNLTRKEFKQFAENNELVYTAIKDSLKIKIEEVLELKTSTAKTRIKFVDKLRDTTIYSMDTILVQVKKTFSYNDGWNKVTGIIDEDSVSIDLQVYDSLVQVTRTYKKAKWFLPRLFEKKKIKTEIVGRNPKANYTVVTEIKVQ